MSVSKDFLRRVFSTRLSQSKLDLLYTLITELDLVCPNPVTLYEMKEFDKVLRRTAEEAKFENSFSSWSQLEKMQELWKLRRKRYVAPDHDLQPTCLKFNF